MFPAVGQDTEKREDPPKVQTTTVAPGRTEQILDRYNLKIGKVIVKGEDLQKLIEAVDPSASRELFLTNVDSLYNVIWSNYLSEKEAQTIVEKERNKRYVILPGMLILLLGMMLVSIRADWKRLIYVSSVLFFITFGFTLYYFPILMELF